MSHNYTKSDNGRLHAALPIRRIDESHDEVDEATATNENFEIPPIPEYVGPKANGVTVTAQINANAGMTKQSEAASNTNKADPNLTLPAETEAGRLDYMVLLDKQIRVWIGGIAVIGTIVAFIIIVPGTGLKSATPLDSQHNALVQISNVLASENWTRNYGWGSTGSNICVRYGGLCEEECVDVCDWHGLDCNDDDEVVAIKLFFNNLHGSIPSELGLLTNLQY
eukprot:CAMPEP_0116024274 /NCGR_PEP_ID=MMETSP0321-20121206/12209_1 /TAXON_ID=163516 /ORGANISM="Leptocylindrus danicus var. danicus, Strain B650" /LENGTH=223 /DNA_ID=CAMNT_0003495953 /DNA_START=275 /DNA_END=943 /DNA_ORIENTATION=+